MLPRIWNTGLLSVLLIFGFQNCTSAQPVAAQEPTNQEKSQTSTVKREQLGETVNVHQCGNIFTAGQFKPTDIATFQSKKIARVITLRTDGEVKWDEQKGLEDAAIEFIKLPIGHPDHMNDEFFSKLRKLLKDESKPTVLHCGSASRVGSAWLPFRVLDQGVDLETAIAESKQIGSRSAAMEAKAIDYIKRTQAKAAPKSVKPGINDNFLDPELDVEKFVKRFEVESREIYVARKAIVAACGIQPGDRVADVGAGTGLFSRLFAETVGETGWVYSVDISTRFLEHINKINAEKKIKNITGVLCAENSVNLPPKSVDFVFICDTYHHFEYPNSTMSSIARALKDDGELIVIDFHRIPGTTREWLMNHVRANQEVFRTEIQDAGFTLVEEKKIDGLKENYCLRFKKSK